MNSPRIHTLLAFSLSAISVASSQNLSTRFWVFFRDRGQVTINLTVPAAARNLGISERALWRRSKVLPTNRLLDERDLPVSVEYVDQVRSTGSRILGTSRWLNAVAVEASPSQRQSIISLPFVLLTDPVLPMKRPPIDFSPSLPQLTLPKSSSAPSLDYGFSFTQLNNIKVVDAHNLGINGSGVVIGMIDNGFNFHRSHTALRDIRLIDEYDFIHGIQSTQRQPWENSSQGNHGQYTLSAVGGFHEGFLVGAAFGASFILAKTEMDSTEVPQEEVLYVQALEWMEQLGADVVSTSLGYIDWYTYDSLDGRTATTSKAARVAASKGVLLVTAMGNEGHFRGPGQTGTMIAPADADSIISAGATYSDYLIADFSSTGPTRDGRVKPEVMAQGVSVVSATGPTASYVGVSGTSLSTPLTAGVAALIFSAHPELTPMQVRDAMIQTAFRYNDPFVPSRTASYPNNYYGYGIVNALAAVTYNGIAFSNKPMVIDNVSSLGVYVWTMSSSPLVTDSLVLHYQVSSGGPFLQMTATPTGTQNLFVVSVPSGSDSSFPRGYFSSRDNAGRTGRLPYNAPDSLLVLKQFIVTEILGLTAIPGEFILNVNYPNPFNAGTSITFDAPASEYVQLEIYDLLGRRVKTVFRGNSTRGRNIYSWNGTDESGKSVSTGVYFSNLRTPKGTLTQRMLFLK